MLSRRPLVSVVFALLSLAAARASAQAVVAPAKPIETLAGTQPLTWEGDLSLEMVDDLHAFADRETAASIERRARHWKRDFTSREAYEKSIEPNRQRLARYLGVTNIGQSPLVRTSEILMDPLIQKCVTYAGTMVLDTSGGASSEAVILDSNGIDHTPWETTVILLPDAGESVEVAMTREKTDAMEIAMRLSEIGLTVIVPRMVDRGTELSVVAKGTRVTQQPHREFVYRQAFEMGRHVVGYEVNAVRSWTALARMRGATKVGVVGVGEGGAVALNAAALEPSLDCVWISGYFKPREAMHQEPIYRNVWGLFDEFGDAELASLIAPRPLVVEAARSSCVEEPTGERMTPGRLATPAPDDVKKEAARFQTLVGAGGNAWNSLILFTSGDGTGAAGSREALAKFVSSLSPKAADRLALNVQADATTPDPASPPHLGSLVSELKLLARDRRHRQVERLIDHTQALVRESEYVRKEFWKNADRASRDPEKWKASTQWYRDYLYDEVLGRFDYPKLPPNARTRKIYDTPKYTGYEVVLDVFNAPLAAGQTKAADAPADVWAYGILLVPKDLKPGEKRPVVVCQHGLEGRPQDTIQGDVPGERAYHEFAAKLAERGFITFAPQNPYIGKTHFRQLVRKLYPLKKTLWSVIIPQHEQITDWLASLEFVDAERIGFYGLSYGGKTAMRVPAIVERYCLSICSGDFNEWIRKCTSVRDPFSYMGTHEYEMYEFDLGHTFNYAEMAYLIAPRPFMVERGHRDGVGIDEWVSYEYAKVRMLYADLKIPERTEIEYFDGPHEIHAVGTFDFLHRHLKWPAPKD